MDWDDIKERVRERSDLVEVINGYVKLTRRGNVYKACCPFHQERTPSFTVDPTRQFFHCFGCKAGGDVFRFIELAERVPFREALELLAERAQIELQPADRANKGFADRRERGRQILDAAAKFYHHLLMEDASGEQARAYLETRSLDEHARKAFHIGFAPAQRDAFLSWGRKQGFKDTEMAEVGMVFPPEPGRGTSDRFQGRVMFPIFDPLGRCIGFSGRILDVDASPAKYYNSPETPFFIKNKVLFGLHRAKKAMVDEGRAIVCEGQVDVIRCHISGIENVVAAQGTALTEPQARLLKRYVEEVVLLLDADAAGQHAALRSIAPFVQAGLDLHIAQLPEGEDPDSLILQQGVEAFQQCIAKAVPAISFHADLLRKRGTLETPAQVDRASKEMLEYILLAPSNVLQEGLINQAATALGIREKSLWQDLERMKMRPAGRTTTSSTAPAAKKVRAGKDERAVIVILWHRPDLKPWCVEFLPEQAFMSSEIRKLYHELLTEDEEGLSLQKLMDRFPHLRDFLSGLAMNEEPAICTEESLKRLIMNLRKGMLERHREALRGQLSQVSMDERAMVQHEMDELALALNKLGQAMLRKSWEAAEPILSLYNNDAL